METSNYIPIILAMTIIVKNAKDYNLEDVDPDPVLEYDTVELSSNTNLALIADITDLSATELRDLNPALLRATAPSGYQLHVPKGKGPVLLSAIENVPAEKRASWRMHKVAAGDTLASIAKRYGSSAGSISNANPREAAELESGDVLLIPCTYVEAKKPAAKKSAHARGRHHRGSTKLSAKSSSHKPTGSSTKRRANAKSLHRKATVKRASR